jgi:hypothetical protein
LLLTALLSQMAPASVKASLDTMGADRHRDNEVATDDVVTQGVVQRPATMTTMIQLKKVPSIILEIYKKKNKVLRKIFNHTFCEVTLLVSIKVIPIIKLSINFLIKGL